MEGRGVERDNIRDGIGKGRLNGVPMTPHTTTNANKVASLLFL